MKKPETSVPFLRLQAQEPRPASTISEELAIAAREDLELHVFPYLREDGSQAPQSDLQLLYQATVGVGKTDVLVRVAGRAILSGLRVAIRVPTVKLAREIVQRIEQQYPGAAGLWLGREQNDPEYLGRQMCPRSQDVRAAKSVGAKPTDVCGSAKRGYCPFHPESSAQPCGYRKQNLSTKAVVIFAGDKMLELSPQDGMKRSAHWAPYEPLPHVEVDLLGDEKIEPAKGLRKVKPKQDRDFDLLLVDETDPLGFLEGFEQHSAHALKPDTELIRSLKIPENAKEILESLVVDLAGLMAQAGDGNYLAPYKPGEMVWDADFDELIAVLEATDTSQLIDVSGRMVPSDFTMVDFIGTLEDLKKIALKSLPKPKQKAQFPKMNAAQIATTNASIRRQRGMLLQISRVCELMVLGLRRDLPHLKHLKVGTQGESLQVRRLKQIGRAFAGIPTMIFDATPRPELLRYVFPNLRLAFKRTAGDGAGVKRIQLIDRDLTDGTLKSYKWPARIALLGQLAHRMHGSAGVIVPKFLRERIHEEQFPELQWGHFGNLRGVNEFEDVGALVVVGRPAPHYSEAEEKAAVLTGQHIETLPEGSKWYPKLEKSIYSRSIPGAGWPVRAAEHPDPIVEEVRASVTEDGVEQALGRGRNTRRTPDRPLVEYEVTTTPTGRPVDGVFSIEELKAATCWIGVFLDMGLWIQGGAKGLGDWVHLFGRVLTSQRLKSQYEVLFGKSAFEGPDQAADWLKSQRHDNLEIGRLASQIDWALKNNAPAVTMLASQYPLDDFQPIRAKVQGARYYAQLYMRTAPDQTPQDALRAFLGPLATEVEMESG